MFKPGWVSTIAGLLLAATLLAVVGCVRPWSGLATVTTVAGARLCAKHGVALVTVDGFRREKYFPDFPPDHLPAAVDAVKAFCPNAVPPDEVLLDPQLGDTFKPVRVTYCPVCERKAQHIYRLNPVASAYPPGAKRSLPQSMPGRFSVRPDPW